MSLTNSLAVLSAAVNDPALVQQTVILVAQNAAAAVSDVGGGKGGFSANATLGEMLEFQLTGLLVVFVVLGGLTIMCVLMAWILKTLAPDQYYCREKTAPVIPTPPVAKLAPADVQAPMPSSLHPGLDDEELIVLLAVAATEALGQAVSVVKFRHMGSMDWTWSVQGRVSLHSPFKAQSASSRSK
ncbi:MAG: hypothetical protein IPJ48_09260 [Propionivibrio sp.]|uniref:Oxaloacetate decarboxylase gamma chain n=1 Tax=Candidatus Propionivibrio dominans TaxID=2954373 RepID=A0A9D7FED4_9RHOO|nr:hypothetical protein [Candidatus Propionivibrio dominans]